MNMDFEVVARLLAPTVSALLSGIIKRALDARASLTEHIGHVSTFELNDDIKTKVFTHSLFLKNRGRKTVENVRVVHNVLPQNIFIHPPVEYSTNARTNEIIIPRLVPKESITISYLYYPPLTCGHVHLHVKSDVGFAKSLEVVEIVRPSRIFNWMFLALCFIGASYLIYWIIKLVGYLANL
ncbi:hypothetical protein IV454_14535 [Massilia antarctica]|uniref:DUF3592 domain-containing protein n=1 Tax=Massilia antarctica TaxID=2765360 RepID=A0AA49AAK6_9BURK|nr:hypothetical protein [Massilia antarctica]QPI52594.1 hypothetical protein IV454_14535 [Massilia antarctica]